jgi:hypothetical protein
VLRLIAKAAGSYTHLADTLLLWAGFVTAEMTSPFQALTVSCHSGECTYGLTGDARVAIPSKYDADRIDGSNIVCASGQEPSFAAQLRKTLNTIPAYTWYALPSGTLTFVNEGYADYLGLAKDDPLRLGVEIDVPWDTHIQLVHPDDQEETLKVGAACNRTGSKLGSSPTCWDR